MAYFDTKSGSLEEAIRQAVGGQKIEEKMDAVNKTAVKKKFDDRKDKDIDNDGDVDSSDKFLHKRRKAISKAMSKDEGNKFTGALNAAREKGEKTFVVSGKTYNVEDYQKEEVDLEEGKMKELAMKIADVYTKMKKDKQMKPFADKFRADVKTSMNIKKSLEKVLPDYVGGGDITKLMGENFIGTPETTKARLDATPGQSSDDWNEQVGVMQKKNDSMREALAKMWGVEEGHNPFKKEEKKASKKEGKTMTGQPETKVTIDPDMKEKVKTETAIGKKNIK